MGAPRREGLPPPAATASTVLGSLPAAAAATPDGGGRRHPWARHVGAPRRAPGAPARGPVVEVALLSGGAATRKPPPLAPSRHRCSNACLFRAMVSAGLSAGRRTSQPQRTNWRKPCPSAAQGARSRTGVFSKTSPGCRAPPDTTDRAANLRASLASPAPGPRARGTQRAPHGARTGGAHQRPQARGGGATPRSARPQGPPTRESGSPLEVRHRGRGAARRRRPHCVTHRPGRTR